MPDCEDVPRILRRCWIALLKVAAYVWDYASGMQLLRSFWDEAVALDPRAIALYEGKRFPLCEPSALVSLFRTGGLVQVEARALEIPTDFTTFDEYWRSRMPDRMEEQGDEGLNSENDEAQGDDKAQPQGRCRPGVHGPMGTPALWRRSRAGPGGVAALPRYGRAFAWV